MSRVTLELRPREEQAAFNLRRWDEVLADPQWRTVQGRVEIDRYGRVTMSPPPAPRHGRYQAEIISLLKKLLAHGVTMGECPISTADGVRAADVAWVSQDRWGELGNRACFVRAPEICVEIRSPANSDEEMREKMALYFDAGAEEIWMCGTFGEVTFFNKDGALSRSKFCPDFPKQV